MRSVIKLANPAGIKAIVDQQFEIGRHILAAGLVPIIEPEIDIHSPEKGEAEALLRTELLAHLDRLGPDERVIFKLTLPEEDDFYAECVDHPRLLKLVALSGGYTREEANARMSRNRGVVASFSRALTEGLNAGQSECRVQLHARFFHSEHIPGLADLTRLSPLPLFPSRCPAPWLPGRRSPVTARRAAVRRHAPGTWRDPAAGACHAALARRASGSTGELGPVTRARVCPSECHGRPDERASTCPA